MTHPADVEVWPMLLAAAQSVTDSLTLRGLPALDEMVVVPGASITVDVSEGCQSKGWVRLVSAYPSSTFPSPDQTLTGACVAPLAVQVEVGIVRCGADITTYPGGGVALPTTQETLEAASLQIADMVALRAAINLVDPSVVTDALAATYTPYGPAGGVVGGYWTAYLGA